MTEIADKFLQEANGKLNSFFGPKLDDASELYAKAAAHFKLSKKFLKAGECYEKAAQCQMKANNEFDAKLFWQESGKCYQHVNPKLAINAYNNAIVLNLQGNRFEQAARLQEEVGDLLAEDGLIEEAIQAFRKSVQYFETENSTSNAQKSMLKIAHVSVKNKNYKLSIEMFEKVAQNVEKLLKFKVKEYYFKAMLCALCQGIQDGVKKWNTQQALQQKYKNASDLYDSQYQGKLIDGVLTSLQKMDVELFKNSVAEFRCYQQTDPWSDDLLSAIEKYIEEQIRSAPDLNDDHIQIDTNLDHETGDNPFQPSNIDDQAPDI